ncbi:MAG TPA: hypothetical protein ENN43_04920 [bacterium]|nr:hypothetical protein [bacterium]
MSERYRHVEGKIYFDTKDKVLVQNMGNRFVYLRHDRRKRSAGTGSGKRAEDSIKQNMIKVSGNLFFDRTLKQLYRIIGGKPVLYTKDRRKSAKNVSRERRKPGS